MNEWWLVAIVHDGKKSVYTVKAPDILSAINIAMVSKECGVGCVILAKRRKITEGFIKFTSQYPGVILFREKTANGKKEQDKC